MKVKIGPYLNWYGPYQILGLLNHVGISKETTDCWAECSPEWFTNLCQWVYDKRSRTIKVKIHDYDVWSMDATLAIIILPMLKKLKSVKHGSPGDMPAFDQTSNSAQYCFDFYEEGDEAAWEGGHDQWVKILDEIIWAFEQIQPDCDWEEQYWITKPELDMANYPEDEGKLTTPVRWSVEGECDWDGMKKHQARITKGLEYFGKYYQSLWD